MLFLVWMVDRHLLTPGQVVEVMRAIGRRSTPIGRVAVEEGLMTMRAVMHTLQAQTENPRERFGDVAIRLGHLDDTQVKALVGAQAWRQPRVNQAVVELGYLSAEAMDAAHQQFASRHDTEG